MTAKQERAAERKARAETVEALRGEHESLQRRIKNRAEKIAEKRVRLMLVTHAILRAGPE